KPTSETSSPVFPKRRWRMDLLPLVIGWTALGRPIPGFWISPYHTARGSFFQWCPGPKERRLVIERKPQPCIMLREYVNNLGPKSSPSLREEGVEGEGDNALK